MVCKYTCKQFYYFKCRKPLKFCFIVPSYITRIILWATIKILYSNNFFDVGTTHQYVMFCYI